MTQLIESAQRLGIELDEAEALQWLTAMATVEALENKESDLHIDEKSGVFGHKIVMLDFSHEELARFRKIGELVGFDDQPGVVETALALSGSSAQSKIQTYPGDADFFERVNIIAPTREKACEILALIMREKALSTMRGAGYQFIEAKFGSFPVTMIKDGEVCKQGSPISWSASEVEDGHIEALSQDGTPLNLRWEDAALDPGWCKLDWVVVDPQRQQLSNVSNMLDVTWEAPDGTITPLDGYLDPYFQEVYLEAESIPIFSKLSKHVSGDALDHYIDQLEKEVRKYISREPSNYGKAAKRMYNVFRLTGRYEEAAYLRELFDEPAALLYQVWSLIRTIDDIDDEDTAITVDQMVKQADQLIISVIEVLEGPKETEIVRILLRLRDSLLEQDEDAEELNPEAEAARAEVINLVNNFFQGEADRDAKDQHLPGRTGGLSQQAVNFHRCPAPNSFLLGIAESFHRGTQQPHRLFVGSTQRAHRPITAKHQAFNAEQFQRILDVRAQGL